MLGVCSGNLKRSLKVRWYNYLNVLPSITIIDKIQITDKKLLHFKLSKSGQILCVNKTGFSKPGHTCIQHYMNFMNDKYPTCDKRVTYS